jgi:mannosyltransferase
VTLTALGLANLFALLIIPAHALTLVALARSRRAPVRRVMAGWLAACGAAATAVSPVIVAGYGQMHQIRWVKVPGLAKMIDVTRLIGPPYTFGTVAAVTVTAAIISAVRARHRPQLIRPAMRPQPVRPAWPPKLWALALPWLLLPPAVLLTVSLVHPIYAFRYTAFCMPAAALLIGAALAGAGPAIAAVGLAVIILAGLPAQVAQRTPAAHKINLRLVDQVVARYAHTGDALLNYSRAGGNNERGLAGIYPFGLGRLRDISQGESPVQSATLGGTYATSRVERQRLATVTRLWVVSWKPQPIPILHQFRVRLLRTWNVGGNCLRLYLIRHHHHHHHHHHGRRTRRVTP